MNFTINSLPFLNMNTIPPSRRTVALSINATHSLSSNFYRTRGCVFIAAMNTFISRSRFCLRSFSAASSSSLAVALSYLASMALVFRICFLRLHGRRVLFDAGVRQSGDDIYLFAQFSDLGIKSRAVWQCLPHQFAVGDHIVAVRHKDDCCLYNIERFHPH